MQKIKIKFAIEWRQVYLLKHIVLCSNQLYSIKLYFPLTYTFIELQKGKNKTKNATNEPFLTW